MSNQTPQDPALAKLLAEAEACQSQGNHSGALIAFKRLQRQFPDFADAWINASALLRDIGRDDEAMAMAQRGIELDPENPKAHCELAMAYKKQGHDDEAAFHYQKALEYDPKHVNALARLAEIYFRKDCFTEALGLNDSAIQAEPSHSSLWAFRGIIKIQTLDFAGAEADLLQAMKLNPKNAHAPLQLALALLLQGRCKEAWPHIDASRSLGLDWNTRQDFGKPHWNGETLNERTLLVYSTHHDSGGLGDVIQFVRFFPGMQQQYGCCIQLLTYKSLKRLLAGIPGIDGIVGEGEPLPPFDVAAPITELPQLLKIDLSNLAPPTVILPKPSPMHQIDRTGFKVGLVWTGSPTNTMDAIRNISPRFLDELADMPGLAWCSLQVPPDENPPRLPGLVDLSPHLSDFMDTAQVAQQLDLVITVDTSVAHLAGSLGIPTIVLLPRVPDWRWGLQGDSTPWYPSATLLRQPMHGDWASVVGMLKAKLEAVWRH
jgi:Flp pilus assembly protein TadD